MLSTPSCSPMRDLASRARLGASRRRSRSPHALDVPVRRTRGDDVSDGYVYEHGWDEERVRLRGLEIALDAGTREHLLRLGVRPGIRCLEIGAGRGAIACWLAEQVAPDGIVVATDLETDFLELRAA